MKKVLSIVKKNLISILCGIVALAAVVALFWPFGGMHDDLQTRATERKAKYDSLVSLVQRKRHIPSIIEGAGEELKEFPSADTIAAGNLAEKNFATGSMNVYKKAVERSLEGQGLPDALRNHPLLVPHSLPEPDSDATAIRFREQYPNKISDIRDLILHAGTPPSENDFTDAANALFESKFRKQIIIIDGKEQNRDDVDKRFAPERDALRVQMRVDAAANHKLYATSDAITLYSGFAPFATPTAMQIWTAQMLLWVEEDIASSIATVNAGSTNVLDAPIKQLIKLDVPASIFVTPAGLLGDITTALPTNNGFSVSGRVPSTTYDVVRFNMILNVDAAKLSTVLNGLASDRFLTVLHTDVVPVPPGPPGNLVDQGYVYGNANIVQLNLDCEYLYMRDWTVRWMPNAEKTVLQIPTPFVPHDPDLAVFYKTGGK